MVYLELSMEILGGMVKVGVRPRSLDYACLCEESRLLRVKGRVFWVSALGPGS